MSKPTVPEVVPIVRALYRRHGAGCCWHLVLDEGNDDLESVKWCAEHVGGDWCSGDTECRRLAELLPIMSRTQIRKLCRMGK